MIQSNALHGKNSASPSQHEHIYGIDLLRMLAMYMVCMLHLLGQGGVLKASESNRSIYWIATFLNIAAYCAVDCFAMISGVVGCKTPFIPKRLFRLWLQALFYSLGLTLVFKFIMPGSIGKGDILNSMFPFSTGGYWYLTSYAIMYFVIPEMNFLLTHQDKSNIRKFLWTFFIIFSLMAMLPILQHLSSPVKLGYSAIWLAYLYMLGGFIRIYGLNDLFPSCISRRLLFQRLTKTPMALLIAYTLCISVTFLLFFGGRIAVSHNISIGKICQRYVCYNSPTILLSAIALLELFMNLNVSCLVPIIRFASPTAFGVYLIHEHKAISSHFLIDKFKWTIDQPAWLFPFTIIVSALIIYTVCSLIDFLRLRLFKKLKLV
ncbi:MAG: acyltransferase family protein [Victivallales bacterium]|nr:acyltransferase family protein [Victivallales bacterium]